MSRGGQGCLCGRVVRSAGAGRRVKQGRQQSGGHVAAAETPVDDSVAWKCGNAGSGYTQWMGGITGCGPSHLPLTLHRGEPGPQVNSPGASAVEQGSTTMTMRDTLLLLPPGEAEEGGAMYRSRSGRLAEVDVAEKLAGSGAVASMGTAPARASST